MKRTTLVKLVFVCLVALFLRWDAPAVVAGPLCPIYCGDGICQDGVCDINGCEIAGSGCRENDTNCSADC